MASAIHWQDLTAAGSAAKSPAPAAKASDETVTKETFLKLLVAQIKNQNPLSPADGIQFLTQLAQFTELEQMIGLRQDVETIRKSVEASAGQPAGTGETAAKQGK